MSYPEKTEEGGYERYHKVPFQFEGPCLVIKPTSKDDLEIKEIFENEVQNKLCIACDFFFPFQTDTS